ncbi:excalibur calcium-binding domain-containing protein [Simplicispira psychrophila]|uniref:excalibur calcium-binding domain-containing protein n=1 Tax=Simplicispira psychrophila TaxID=80882 RepID=UPI000488BF97|nr:excalibur calcium-binding domain-containing protein [Simplicispira psychrophila]
MRFEGTLAKWNDDRGFGFIQPTQGGQELFAHISAFPRDGQRPQLNEPLSFEVALAQGGKKQAVAIQRPGAVAPRSTAARRTPPQLSRNHSSTGVFGKLVVLLLVCAVLGVGYSKYDAYQQARASATVAAPWEDAPPAGRSIPAVAPLVPSSYRCDSRQHCSQMTSCAEATFFLKNCPTTKMDGDGDGVPCEQQWCTR